ncbi:hypothetical protein QE369_004438 [Agrobacterium larrymoorei]|uniref:Uncharacterized protein n=1 Tax=Agrobacterium larrymoorei TaxID=160699 RepID=A0AAJ2BJQ2_9HYPH|nr:hypothetical protein [Agrobacterium larrymoorei]
MITKHPVASTAARKEISAREPVRTPQAQPAPHINLKVAARLNSYNASDQAAKQDVFVHRLGAKRILRTNNFTAPPIPKAETEDLLRDALVKVAASDLGIGLLTGNSAPSP